MEVEVAEVSRGGDEEAIWVEAIAEVEEATGGRGDEAVDKAEGAAAQIK